jgi:hypothetical protein
LASSGDATGMMWRDKLVVDMTREELIDAVVVMARLLRSSHENHKHTLDMWNTCNRARGDERRADEWRRNWAAWPFW